jgi:hypothetical protein
VAGRVLLDRLTVMLKMAAVHYYEMSINFNETTQLHTPENGILVQLHTPENGTLLGGGCENYRSLIDQFFHCG